MTTTLMLMAIALAPLTAPVDEAASTGLGYFWGDLDGDAVLELIIVNPAGDVRLQRNAGDGVLVDQTLESGLGDLRAVHEALWGDYDSDGREDVLFLMQDGTGRLFRSEGHGGLIEVGPWHGLELVGCTGAEWFDYDADGLLDVLASSPQGDELFHNEGGFFRRADLGASAGSGASSSSSASSGGITWEATPLPDPPDFCVPTIEDASAPTNCLPAASTATLGALLPLSKNWSIDPITGYMGLQNSDPQFALDVDGMIRSRFGGFQLPDGTTLVTETLQGTQGAAGNQGPSGSAGATGATGPAAGPTGPDGATGPQGSAGPGGSQGPVGAAGATGAAGSAGAAGVGFSGTQYLTLGAASFVSDKSDQRVIRAAGTAGSQGAHFPSASSSVLYAPIHLPQGAKITGMTFSGYKTITQQGLACVLRKLFHASTSSSTIGLALGPVGVTGNYSVVGTMFSTPTVDYSDGVYYIQVQPQGVPWGGGNKVTSVVIAYTL